VKLTPREQQRLADLRNTVLDGQMDLLQELAGKEHVQDVADEENRDDTLTDEDI
jgi:hypothetical protein